MLLSSSAGGVIISALGSSVFAASGAGASRLAFSAAVTCIAAHGTSLVVSCDNKSLSGVTVSGIESGSAAGAGGELLRLIETVALPRRCSALVVAPAPAGAGVGANAAIAVVGDKVGDVSALGLLPALSRRRMLSGHVASIITALALGGDVGDLLCAGDRDEKIRVSALCTPHRIEAYCLGHTRAVVALAPALAHVAGYQKAELLASAGGDGALRLWHTRSGTLLSSLYFRPNPNPCASRSRSRFDVFLPPPGVSHVDEDTTFTKNDDDTDEAAAAETVADAAAAEAEEDADNAGADEGGADDGATATGPLRPIPSPLEGRGSTTLPPSIVPASLIALVSPSGSNLFATFIVGENTVRLLRIVPTGARVAVASVAGGAAALASGAGAEGVSGVTLEQLCLSPLGALKLPNSVPLGLGSDSSSTSTLFLGVAGRGGCDEQWVPHVVALAVTPSSGAGEGWEWDPMVGAAERVGSWCLTEMHHAGALALSEAFGRLSVAERPSWTAASSTEEDISRLASPMTANAAEMDKSWVKPKREVKEREVKRGKNAAAEVQAVVGSSR